MSLPLVDPGFGVIVVEAGNNKTSVATNFSKRGTAVSHVQPRSFHLGAETLPGCSMILLKFGVKRIS
jgi:hypothetical protein